MIFNTKAGKIQLNAKTYRKMLKYRKSGRRGLLTKNKRIQKKIVKENLLSFAISVNNKIERS